MNEMVERAARAAYYGWPWKRTPIPWERLPDNMRADWRLSASAAIEAMRKPTEAMMAAVDLPDEDADYATQKITEIWQGMIDAAISPSPSPEVTDG